MNIKKTVGTHYYLLLTIVTIIFIFSVFQPRVQADIISNFDTSLEGWTTNDSGPFTHQPTGGNSGGFLQLDNSEITIAQIQAPAKFLGDLSDFIGGTFSFDGNLLGNGGSFFDGPNSIPTGPFLDYGIVQIIGTSSSAQVDLLPNGATAPFQSWQTYSVELKAAAWGVSDSAFTSLMSNVTGINIVMESLYGPEIQGVDNVQISSSVPEPSTYALLLTGLLGFGVIRWKYSEKIRHKEDSTNQER